MSYIVTYHVLGVFDVYVDHTDRGSVRHYENVPIQGRYYMLTGVRTQIDWRLR